MYDNKIKYNLLVVILFVICFLTTINKITYLILGFSLGNVFIALLAFSTAIIFFGKSEKLKLEAFAYYKLAWLILIFIGGIKVFSAYEIFGRALSSYTRLVLIPTAIILPIYFKLSMQEIKKILSVIYNFGFIIGLIALLQVGLRDVLPEFLLNYKVQGERIDDYVFSDLIIMRANGLFGNPLELSVFFVLVSVPAILYNLNSKKYYISFMFIAVVSTLSRAAIAAYVLAILLGLIHGNYTFRLRLTVVSCFIAAVLFFSYFEIAHFAAVLDRLSGSSAESSSSSLTRLNYLNEAVKTISNFPEIITGVDLGTYTSGSEEISSSIQDGYFLNYVADYGPILFTFLLLSHLALILLALKFILSIHSRMEGYLILYFNLLWLFFCAVNSAFLHASISFLFYFLLGIYIRTVMIKQQSRVQAGIVIVSLKAEK